MEKLYEFFDLHKFNPQRTDCSITLPPASHDGFFISVKIVQEPETYSVFIIDSYSKLGKVKPIDFSRCQKFSNFNITSPNTYKCTKILRFFQEPLCNIGTISAIISDFLEGAKSILNKEKNNYFKTLISQLPKENKAFYLNSDTYNKIFSHDPPSHHLSPYVMIMQIGDVMKVKMIYADFAMLEQVNIKNADCKIVKRKFNNNEENFLKVLTEMLQEIYKKAFESISSNYSSIENLASISSLSIDN